MDLAGGDFLMFMAIGLCAQLIDGALGMAYGLTSSSILLAMGLPPATASASVHAAEVFTTGFSGAAHGMFGNVDRKLLRRLVVPGVIGGMLGAYVLTRLDGDAIKPWIYGYLLVLAALILLRAAGHRYPSGKIKRVGVLGFFAGLLDAIGGGGWGPLATSTLLARGGDTRTSIGTVNAAEFSVTLAISITFLLSIGIDHWQVVLGLLVGGVIAAPLAAMLVKHLPERAVLIAVGVLVLGISVYQISSALVASTRRHHPDVAAFDTVSPPRSLQPQLRNGVPGGSLRRN
jgi:uncharacterized membrane protein YfcA